MYWEKPWNCLDNRQTCIDHEVGICYQIKFSALQFPNVRQFWLLIGCWRKLDLVVCKIHIYCTSFGFLVCSILPEICVFQSWARLFCQLSTERKISRRLVCLINKNLCPFLFHYIRDLGLRLNVKSVKFYWKLYHPVRFYLCDAKKKFVWRHKLSTL